jgi:hypothetical protein
MTIRRTIATAVAAAALVAPAAQAQPADMHASTAQAAAKAAQQPKQDLRTPDARDAAAAVTLHRSVHVVKAPPAMAADGGGGGGELAPAPAVNAPAATAVESASRLPAAGQPTWPVDPAPIAAPAPQVVSDDGSPVPVIPLVGGALLVLIAALSARPLARHMARGTRVA